MNFFEFGLRSAMESSCSTGDDLGRKQTIDDRSFDLIVDARVHVLLRIIYGCVHRHTCHLTPSLCLLRKQNVESVRHGTLKVIFTRSSRRRAENLVEEKAIMIVYGLKKERESRRTR